MSDDPRDLYKNVILRHNNAPFHYEKRPEAALIVEAYNPLCGDQFKLYLHIQEGRVLHAYFYGYGCAISKASTSVLVQQLEGLDFDEIEQLSDKFIAMVTPEAPLPDDVGEEMMAFAAARRFPARRQCATLSWDALMNYLKKVKRD